MITTLKPAGNPARPDGLNANMRRFNFALGNCEDWYEAIQLRANYAIIFNGIGGAQLTDWAQLAIDTHDEVLADSVIREVSIRRAHERPFRVTEFIEIFCTEGSDGK